MASFESPTNMYISPTGSKEPIYNSEEKESIKTYPKDFPVTKLPRSITNSGGNPTYTLKSGIFLYRGSEEKNLPLQYLTGIHWYALDLHKVFYYGYPSKYRVNNDLTLLAIDKITKEHPFYRGLNPEMQIVYNNFFSSNKNGDKKRKSIPQNDYDLCDYICNTLGYDGYAMNEMQDDDEDNGMFHAEVALNNGNEKLRLIEHINVDNIQNNKGEHLIDKRGDPITNRWIASEVLRNKQRAEGLKNRKSKRRFIDPYDEPLENPPLMFNDENISPFKLQKIPFNSYDSPPPAQRNSLFPLSTGGKTRKNNKKKAKKSKKKQTKKKIKKSKRKSNKK